MRLKHQLLVASLLTLLIPWAGLQFVLELDQALREQTAQQLRLQASRLAGVADTLRRDQLPAAPVLYARQLNGAINLDGYGDDWPGYRQPGADSGQAGASPPVSWQAGVSGRFLYLLVKVRNHSAVYFDPGRPQQPHDHLRLYWQAQGQQVEYRIRTPAPGPVTGWRFSPSGAPQQDHRVTGHWEAGGSGWHLELRLPRPVERLGLRVHAPAPGGNHTRVLGGTGTDPLPALISPAPALEARLDELLAPGQSVHYLHPDGWILARAQLESPGSEPGFDDLGPEEIVERISLNLLRALVRHFQPRPVALGATDERVDSELLPDSGLVRFDGQPPVLVATAATADGGRILLQQSLERILALSGTTLGSVIARSTLFIVVIMLVLLGYASWLSWRITRLQQAVSASVDGDGRVLAALPASRQGDELGALSRQFSQMVDSLQGYTRYLESFAQRLSHELKTPVAVIRSSLENLAQDSDADNRGQYLERARQATGRLNRILQGMSEAARLEQSFDHAEQEVFDLAPVAAEAASAYQALSPDHRIHYRGPDTGCVINGSAELLVQLLDRLVDNARDFTPAGNRIEIRLQPLGASLELSVFNEGSSLPQHLGGEIFSPFVTLREDASAGHLGQGLVIVRLIAEYHGGRVRAANDSSDGATDGVRFTVTLPRP